MLTVGEIKQRPRHHFSCSVCICVLFLPASKVFFPPSNTQIQRVIIPQLTCCSFFFLSPDREPREAVSFSRGKWKWAFSREKPGARKATFHWYVLPQSSWGYLIKKTLFFFTQGDHMHDASIKPPCPWVTCNFSYQHWSLMQIRTLSSPVCLLLIMTPIRHSHQLGDSAIVIAT